MKKITKYLCELVIAFTAVNANAIAIVNLFDGASISSGDKLFDNWFFLAQPDPVVGPMDLA